MDRDTGVCMMVPTRFGKGSRSTAAQNYEYFAMVLLASFRAVNLRSVQALN